MVMLTKELIFELRTFLGLSAEAFGARVDVTGNTVFRWESGERHPNYSRQIALNKILKDAQKDGFQSKQLAVA